MVFPLGLFSALRRRSPSYPIFTRTKTAVRSGRPVPRPNFLEYPYLWTFRLSVAMLCVDGCSWTSIRLGGIHFYMRPLRPRNCGSKEAITLRSAPETSATPASYPRLISYVVDNYALDGVNAKMLKSGHVQ